MKKTSDVTHLFSTRLRIGNGATRSLYSGTLLETRFFHRTLPAHYYCRIAAGGEIRDCPYSSLNLTQKCFISAARISPTETCHYNPLRLCLISYSSLWAKTFIRSSLGVCKSGTETSIACVRRRTSAVSRNPDGFYDLYVTYPQRPHIQIYVAIDNNADAHGNVNGRRQITRLRCIEYNHIGILRRHLG